MCLSERSIRNDRNDIVTQGPSSAFEPDRDWSPSLVAVHHYLPHPSHLQNSLTMSSRASGSSTALRRLMTEYKQLTSGGTSCATLLVMAHLIKPYYARPVLALAQARQMACSQPVRTALQTNLATIEHVTRRFRALTQRTMCVCRADLRI
jgi:hypothetical protein